LTAQHPPMIRLLANVDAAKYREIRLESLRLHPEAFASTFERESEQPLPWFEDRITEGNIFGAFVGDELVGVAGCWPQQGPKVGHKAVLWGMYVRPAARQLGLGRRLVEAVVNHAASRVEQLQLSVVSANEAAFGLYRSMGFSEFGREMKALKHNGQYFDDILMVRFL
jgi:ribosomal protein S18 acetylase RimI-like enzyme